MPRAHPGLVTLRVPVQKLGESIRWYDALGRLVFVDIHAPHVALYDPATGALTIHPTPQRVGGVHLGRSGRLIVTLERSIEWMDPETGALEPITPIGDPADNTRTNDGRSDPSGALWVPTMPMQPRRPGVTGTMYRLAPDGAPEPLFGGFEIPNAVAFAPDGRSVTYADTPRRTIWRREIDPATGAVGPEAVFVTWGGDVVGRPDGACMDEAGGLWIAMARDGARVERRRPDGSLDFAVAVPARRPTMPALGGPGRTTLFVTSMSHNLEPAAEPGWQDGAIFAIPAGHCGLAETPVDDSGYRARRF